MNIKAKLIKLICSVACESDLEGQLGSCPDRKFAKCRKVEQLDYCAVQHIVDHLIENGVTIQRWIPVSERMPENNDVHTRCEVLAIHRFGKVAVREAEFVRLHPYMFTHWIPIPEPPKEC